MSRARPEDERHDPEEVIEVASELQAEEDVLVTREEMRAIATDVGLAPRQVDRAMAEIARRKARAARWRTLGLRAVVVTAAAVLGYVGWAQLDRAHPTGAESGASADPGAHSAAPQPTPGTQPGAPQPAAEPALATRDPMVSLAPYFAEPPPEPTALAGLRIGIDTHRGKPADAADVLRARGAAVRDVVTPLTAAVLAEIDALVLIDARASAFDAAETAAVDRFVREGGALVVADLGWSWTEYVRRPIEELPVNALGQALGFQVTSEVAGLPAAIDPGALPGVTGFSRDAWVPCLVTARSGAGRPLVRDPQGRPLVLGLDAGRGRVVLFGHMSLPTQNPTMFVRALQHAARRGV